LICSIPFASMNCFQVPELSSPPLSERTHLIRTFSCVSTFEMWACIAGNASDLYLMNDKCISECCHRSTSRSTCNHHAMQLMLDPTDQHAQLLAVVVRAPQPVVMVSVALCQVYQTSIQNCVYRLRRHVLAHLFFHLYSIA